VNLDRWIMLRAVLLSILVPLLVTTVERRNAEAFFPWKTDLSPTDRWQFVVGDFDSDGNTDLLGYQPLNGSIWFARNIGSSFRFVRWRDMYGGDPRGWRLVASDHFDGDGRPDVLFYHPHTGALSVHFNILTRFARVGPTIFLPHPDPDGWRWRFVVGDFNTDGRVDIVAYDANQGVLHLGRNTRGRFAFAEHSRELPYRRGWSFDAGDFNRDGRVDLLGYQLSDGSLHLGIEDGTRFNFSELRAGLGARSRFVAGNFHHTTGNSDIIRHDVETGDLYRGVNAFDSIGGFEYSGPWATLPSPIHGQWQLLAGHFFGDSRSDLVLYDATTGILWVGSDQQPFEGYSWPLSVAPGGPIDFYVSGAGERRLQFSRFKGDADHPRRIGTEDHGGADFVPKVQFTNQRPWRDGAGWNSSLTFRVPGHWPSGIYSARLTSILPEYRSESHITFVVKPALRRDDSEVAVLANVNTWIAYTRWGGRGKYQGAARVSFIRPKPSTSPAADSPRDIMPSQQELPYPDVVRAEPQHLARGELWVLGWLEDNGYRPDVYTDMDFHNGAVHRRGYKVLVLNTHPEYWTAQMYRYLRDFLAGGGSLLYLAGNGIYENAEYLDEQTRIEFYGGRTDGSAADRRARVLFRTANRLTPERNLLGIATANCSVAPAPFRVEPSKRDHELFAGIDWRENDGEFGTQGLNTGWECNGAGSCWEVDTEAGALSTPPADECATGGGVRVDAGTRPPNLEVLARARNADGKGAEMVFYPHAGGGFVLSVGSITFGGTLWTDETSQTVVRNFLTKAGVR
jgi:FG-GAP-like repeat